LKIVEQVKQTLISL